MNSTEELLFLFGILAITAVVIGVPVVIFVLAGKARRKRLRELAESWGWSFENELPADVEQRLQDSFLLKAGGNTTLHNALIHRGDNQTHIIFDVRHQRGKSTDTMPETFSVLLVEGFPRKLPAFLWRSTKRGEGTWQARFFGYEPPPSGLPAVESPAIPDEFRLFGEPADAVKKCFSAAVVAQLVRRPELIVECIDSCVLFYDVEYELQPNDDEIKSWHRKHMALLKLMLAE